MDYQYSFCTTSGGGQSRRQLKTVLVANGSTEMSALAAERIAIPLARDASSGMSRFSQVVLRSS
jgi:hypothetical protein